MNAKTYRMIGLVVVGAAGFGGITAAIVVSAHPPKDSTPRQSVQVQQAASRSTDESSATVSNPVGQHAPPPVVRRTKADDPTYVPPLHP